MYVMGVQRRMGWGMRVTHVWGGGSPEKGARLWRHPYMAALMVAFYGEIRQIFHCGAEFRFW